MDHYQPAPPIAREPEGVVMRESKQLGRREGTKVASESALFRLSHIAWLDQHLKLFIHKRKKGRPRPFTLSTSTVTTKTFDIMSSDTAVYSLEGKNLKLTSREDIEPYIAEINAIQDLQEIHLGGNTLGVGACQALGDVLKNKKNLRVSGIVNESPESVCLYLYVPPLCIKVANFADIFTGRLISEIPDALRALCDSLIEHTSLVEINLSDNAFGGRSAEPMVNFLTHNHHFSVLKLNNNGLGIQGGKIVATALIESAAELKKLGLPSKLKTVICGRNRLEDGSAPTWAKAYAAHGNLEEVRMFQNGIRMDGIIAITQGLASCPNLKVLDLQDNTATLRGSRGIAACLPSWGKLEVLNLSDCLLKPKGGYLVIDALSKGANSNLKRLQLQYCDLDRRALERLAVVVEGEAIKGLEKLDINGNWADEEDECIEKIKKGLQKHGHEDALDELDEM